MALVLNFCIYAEYESMCTLISVVNMQECTGNDQHPAPGGAAAGSRPDYRRSTGEGVQETCGGTRETVASEHRG